MKTRPIRGDFGLDISDVDLSEALPATSMQQPFYTQWKYLEMVVTRCSSVQRMPMTGRPTP